MGILDDAIREHLELKRRHGAAEEEVRQQEAEVLGIRSDPDPRALTSRWTDGGRRRRGAARGGGARGRRGARARPGSRSPEPAEALEPEPEPAFEPEPEPEPVAFEGDPVRPSRARARRRRASGDTPARGVRSAEEEQEDTRSPRRRARRARARRARGDARLPSGDPGARPALVRAEAAARLRLRLRNRAQPAEPVLPPGEHRCAAGRAGCFRQEKSVRAGRAGASPGRTSVLRGVG